MTRRTRQVATHHHTSQVGAARVRDAFTFLRRFSPEMRACRVPREAGVLWRSLINLSHNDQSDASATGTATSKQRGIHLYSMATGFSRP
jgi:hypothetical protein